MSYILNAWNPVRLLLLPMTLSYLNNVAKLLLSINMIFYKINNCNPDCNLQIMKTKRLKHENLTSLCIDCPWRDFRHDPGDFGYSPGIHVLGFSFLTKNLFSSFCGPHFFYLLDYVTRRSEKCNYVNMVVAKAL